MGAARRSQGGRETGICGRRDSMTSVAETWRGLHASCSFIVEDTGTGAPGRFVGSSSHWGAAIGSSSRLGRVSKPLKRPVRHDTKSQCIPGRLRVNRPRRSGRKVWHVGIFCVRMKSSGKARSPFFGWSGPSLNCSASSKHPPPELRQRPHRDGSSKCVRGRTSQ